MWALYDKKWAQLHCLDCRQEAWVLKLPVVCVVKCAPSMGKRPAFTLTGG